MRILVASLLIAAACGGPQQKKDNTIVDEGSAATPDSCCCKTIPETAEKEIIPVYAMLGRMDCSSKHGDCVPDVQCNGAAPAPNPVAPPKPTDVPPPPDLPSGGGDLPHN